MEQIITVEECIKHFTSRKNTYEAIEKLIEYRLEQARNSVLTTNNPTPRGEERGKHKRIMDEYIIVNKTAIQKRIEELEVWSEHNEKVGEYDFEGAIISELKQILSQSTPLIPEITLALHQQAMYDQKEIDKYISDLKLK